MQEYASHISCSIASQRGVTGLLVLYSESIIEMYLLKVLVLLSLLSLALSTAPYQNTHEGPLSFECPQGYGLYKVLSRHDIDRRRKRSEESDRLWSWKCRKIDKWGKNFCYWFEGINDVGQAMFFQCPPDAFMAGVKSVHDDASEDRTWDVKCCRILNVCMQHCTLSARLNTVTDILSHTADDDCGVFVGFFSDFFENGGDEDREYRLGECQFGDCNHPKKFVYKK